MSPVSIPSMLDPAYWEVVPPYVLHNPRVDEHHIRPTHLPKRDIDSLHPSILRSLDSITCLPVKVLPHVLMKELPARWRKAWSRIPKDLTHPLLVVLRVLTVVHEIYKIG
jgi:hypothetical protein